MEKIKIKIGDIVKAKFGTVVFGVTKTDGTHPNSNFDIYGIVTDIIPDEQTKVDLIEVKFFFDATSSHKYKPDDLELICSTNLVKANTKKLTLEQIFNEYSESDVVMGEMLASIPADGLSVEEAFELYMEALKSSCGDRFFREVEDSTFEEYNGGWEDASEYLEILKGSIK
ncbi:hypothetical protein [Dysgonomonas sp. GY617]|uniref:hypothetical protein n=1 Tax=Dysgonomonas sp. GY617 TaxID=2780420 RepID=UPI0018F048BA|nr:hypothetical protein [Dysgonomonas sp. GY617]